MKRTTPQIKSFRSKLLLVMLAVGLIPLTLVFLFYQSLLDQRITQDIETSSIDKLRYTSMNIQRQMEISDQLLGWFSYNRQLENILSTEYEQLYEKQLDIISFNAHALEYAINANIESSIFKILIIDNDGTSFQIGGNQSLLNKEAIVDAEWLEAFNKSHADHLIKSKDHYVNDTYIFPISSKIYSSTSGRQIGWCLITFQNDMYSRNLPTDTEGNGIFLINRQGQCIGNTDASQVGLDYSADPVIQSILDSTGVTGHFTSNRDGTHLITYYYHVPGTNIIEIQERSLSSHLHEQKRMLQLSLFLLCTAAALILLVTLYLSKVLTRPINQISTYIQHVSEGDFRGNLKLRGESEFKVIADSINAMETEIRQLMEKQRQEAEIKKDLEFRVLQNQINPHFLYNTLNTIKWMATLQHSDSIRDMTGALGRLLQNISKGSDKISIYEEMSLLDDYVLIQDIKYDGRLKVSYHIGTPEITQARIIKFVLQPIVENAIFHGIEPKEDDAGSIDIYLSRHEDQIHINIVDNGVGMTEEQIRSMLDPSNALENHRGLNGIGISNINERIKMAYGAQYGISITSQPGSYTDVLISIPYEEDIND